MLRWPSWSRHPWRRPTSPPSATTSRRTTCASTWISALSDSPANPRVPRPTCSATFLSRISRSTWPTWDFVTGRRISRICGWVAEALAWNGALQDIVRRAVRRPRPFLYTPGVYPSERDRAEAGFSYDHFPTDVIVAALSAPRSACSFRAASAHGALGAGGAHRNAARCHDDARRDRHFARRALLTLRSLSAESSAGCSCLSLDSNSLRA